MPFAVGKRAARDSTPSRSRARAAAHAYVASSERDSSIGSTRSGLSDSSVGFSDASSFLSNASGCSDCPSRRPSESPRIEEEGVDLCGPFIAEIVADGSPRSAPSGRHVLYTLRVKGTDGDHTVRRRYTYFAEMSKALDPHGDFLPQMPPKSFFRKQISPGFRDERARVLGQLLAAAVKDDPFATHPSFRSFLGISKLEVGEEPRPLPRILSGIAEVEHESYNSSCKSNHPSRPSSNRSSYAAQDAARLPVCVEVVRDVVPSSRTGHTPAWPEQASSGRAPTKAGTAAPTQNAEASTGRVTTAFGPVAPTEEMPLVFELVS